MGVTCPTLRPQQRKKKPDWFGLVRRKLVESSSSSHCETNSPLILYTNTSIDFNQEETKIGEEAITIREIEQKVNSKTTVVLSVCSYLLTQQHGAAVIIQAYFRRHLARRAFRALRSLVKLQGVVRGVIVRRQARIAFDCTNALARLHLTIQARQLLRSSPVN